MPSDVERVADDAELLAAARRHYDGGGDLADQLWWLEHPGSRGPSGAEDPLPPLESARAALYRPDPPAGLDADAVQRAMAQVTADRDAARAAVDLARAERPALRQEGATRPAPSRPILLVLGVAVAAVLVGAATGFALGRFGMTPAPKALAVFDRAQQTHDRPPVTASLPPFAPASAYRLIDSSPSTGAYAYGVRRTDGEICLVVVVLAQSAYSACTSAAGFAAGGLSLTLSVNVDPENDSGISQPVGIAPRWAPDGRFTF